MEWLVILIVGVIGWAWLKGRESATTAAQTTAEVVEPEGAVTVPEIKVTITTSVARPLRDENEPRNVGELTAAGESAWVLNPLSPLPMTVIGAERPVAERLKAVLATTDYWSQKVPDVALLIAQHNLRFKEADAFVEQHKRRFDAEVEKQIAVSTEWQGASAKDREDLRAEFEEKALQSLGISIGRADFALLLAGQPEAFTEDDELLRRFGDDAALYSFYLTQLSRSIRVVTVKADDYWRRFWEQLAEKGLARRGREIPAQLLLEGLRLKDLNELLQGTIAKPLGRKAKAVDAALALPDLQDRLAQRISFREMFEAIPPADIDLSVLVKSFAYASALATVVQRTFYTGVQTLDAIDERKREQGLYDAWQIRNWQDPLPACAAAVCKKYDRLPAKRPPFHVGCDCQLECSFRD